MRSHTLLLVISFFAVFSCDEDPVTTCSVKNPVEDLAWLAAEIQVMEESGMSHTLYVTQAKYGFMTVFLFRNCCPSCLSLIPVYNCSGDRIGNIGTGEGDINPGILDRDAVIWKPDNSICNFN